MIITRNSESKLSPNLKDKQKLFIDKTYSRDEIIKYCLDLMRNPPNNQNKIIKKNIDNIRDGIKKNLLTNYTINILIFNDPKILYQHLLKFYRNIFIYCENKEQAENINNKLNRLQKNSSSCTELDKPFLVSENIIDSNYRGICFLNLSSPDIIKYALKLDSLKIYANIILPYMNDNIIDFIKKINDNRIQKSFDNKILGGYISIDKIEDDEYIDIKYDNLIDKIKKNYKNENLTDC